MKIIVCLRESILGMFQVQTPNFSHENCFYCWQVVRSDYLGAGMGVEGRAQVMAPQSRW